MSNGKPFRGGEYAAAYEVEKSFAKVASIFGVDESTVRRSIRKFREDTERLSTTGYVINPDPADRTPAEAWDAHKGNFERKISKILSSRWPIIKRKRGPYVVFHSTDEHLDDDSTPLRLIEADIKASHDMGAIMCHGGDLLNNWPLAGRLAKQWAEQACTKGDALLRAQHFISIFKPDVWTDGNHEEFNPYLNDLFATWLGKNVIHGDWTANFVVKSEGGRDLRVVMSHKFQKGSSWFHKAHGHIREMLEGEEADLLLDGHLHSDGVLDHSLPERGHSALCVASAGYKIVDKYAARISHGGTTPKLRGRAHWIVVDPFAEPDANFCVAFKSPEQAQAYLGSLQNLRAI
jgi:hypothetical protein